MILKASDIAATPLLCAISAVVEKFRDHGIVIRVNEMPEIFLGVD